MGPQLQPVALPAASPQVMCPGQLEPQKPQAVALRIAAPDWWRVQTCGQPRVPPAGQRASNVALLQAKSTLWVPAQCHDDHGPMLLRCNATTASKTIVNQAWWHMSSPRLSYAAWQQQRHTQTAACCHTTRQPDTHHAAGQHSPPNQASAAPVPSCSSACGAAVWRNGCVCGSCAAAPRSLGWPATCIALQLPSTACGNGMPACGCLCRDMI